MKKKVLVADDDPAIVDCLQIMLEDANYDVVITSNGQTIALAKSFHPNVILLDIWMSGQDWTGYL